MRTVSVFGAGVKLPLVRVMLLAAVLGCLVWQTTRIDAEALHRALQGDVSYGYLLAGLAVYFTAVLLTFVRWWLLARAVASDCNWGRPCAGDSPVTSCSSFRWAPWEGMSSRPS